MVARLEADPEHRFANEAAWTRHLERLGITTLAVTFIHNRPDWPAAFVWGALVYFVTVRTKSLGACVIMHAVGNLILGIYVLQTRQWGFW